MAGVERVLVNHVIVIAPGEWCKISRNLSVDDYVVVRILKSATNLSGGVEYFVQWFDDDRWEEKWVDAGVVEPLNKCDIVRLSRRKARPHDPD